MSPIGIYRGPFIGQRPDKGLVHPGDEMEVTDADLQSGHWEAKDAPQTPAQTPSFATGGIVSPPTATADPAAEGAAD